VVLSSFARSAVIVAVSDGILAMIITRLVLVLDGIGARGYASRVVV
jgi:hypothetical protein